MEIYSDIVAGSELKQLRDLNSKHFFIEPANGKAKVQGFFDSNPLHYFNKISVGDGEVRWRGIDKTLLWDDEKKGWFFEFDSFIPFLPEYADEWIEFRDVFDGKDQSVRFKPICEHVAGVMFDKMENVTESNGVLYEDAFGRGRDLILYFTQTELKKVVRIREGFGGTADVEFNFKVEFPKGHKIYRADESFETSYKLLLNENKTLDSGKQTLIMDEHAEDGEVFTYLKPFVAWDSENQINIEVDLTVGDDIILTKKIPAEFLINSSGDVFSDVTTGFYGSGGNGSLQSSSTYPTWEACVSVTNATQIYGGGAGRYINANGTSTYKTCDRIFLWFNTSSIDDTASITDVDLTITRLGGFSTGMYISVVNHTSAYLNRNDFSFVGSNKFAEVYANSMSYNTPKKIELSSDSFSFIDKTGNTKLALRSSWDVDIETPVGGREAYIGLQANSNASYRPYLEVTYIIPLPPSVYAGSDKNTDIDTTISPFSDASMDPVSGAMTKAEYKVVGEVDIYTEIPQGGYPTLLDAVQAFEYEFTADGTKECILKVTNAYDLSAEDSLDVVVNPPDPPIVYAGADKGLFIEETIAPFSDATISAGTGTLTGAFYKVIGEVDVFTEIPQGAYPTLLDAVHAFEYQFLNGGTIECVLKATDSYNLSDEDSLDIVVDEPAKEEILGGEIVEDVLTGLINEDTLGGEIKEDGLNGVIIQ